MKTTPMFFMCADLLISVPLARRLRLLEQVRHALLNLVWREIFLARGDPPRVALGIGDRSGAIAPELILHRHLDRRAGADGLVEERVGVLDVNPPRCRRAAVF